MLKHAGTECYFSNFLLYSSSCRKNSLCYCLVIEPFRGDGGDVNLLLYHLPAVFLTPARCLETPHIDPVGGVCVLAPLKVAPEVAVVVSVVSNVLLHYVGMLLQPAMTGLPGGPQTDKEKKKQANKKQNKVHA